MKKKAYIGKVLKRFTIQTSDARKLVEFINIRNDLNARSAFRDQKYNS